jgi:hypothetical protein
MSMFSNIKDLKEFIIWAKKEKITDLEVDGVKVKFSPLSIADVLEDEEGRQVNIPNYSPAPKSEEDIDEEEALYWSAR